MSDKIDDIHDYFMNHPDDLPRIKYQRLILEITNDLQSDMTIIQMLQKWRAKLELSLIHI